MEEGEEEAYEIERLPEELLSAKISRTAPHDAYVYKRQLPHRAARRLPGHRRLLGLPSHRPLRRSLGQLPALRSPAARPTSKKELFLRISDGPLLLPDRLMTYASIRLCLRDVAARCRLPAAPISRHRGRSAEIR
ncbi:hypothetical protein E2562_009050 [Oryza meyeriana var. granulata]|uniref:Uncharacterized protein n=1 Tax=Oryza meyeriana var. granulata TaxID=110450 RepID=A0A6G1D1L4_9ORYZ|nr:hypothetical protein E2562_009050 [Oryza meyeriana var. granulata]